MPIWIATRFQAHQCFIYTFQSTCTFLAWSLGSANYTVLDMILPLLYSASSLGRLLIVITFLHQLYLPKFVYAARTYFHARSTTKIFAQGYWQHFPKTNSYSVAIFLWHHRHCSTQLWRSWLAQQQNNERFPGVSSRPDLSMSIQNLKIWKLFLTQDSQASL